MTENAKKKILSRQEAAYMLGVRPQSISNYVERGLIRAVHSKTNNFFFLSISFMKMWKRCCHISQK